MEKIRQNIFSIGEVYELQRENQWVEKNRETFREYGYFGGGNYLCVVQRIDYSNDTQNSSPRGTFLVRFERVAGAGNSNYGWHGGRDLFGGSLIQRIDYSNDSQNSSSRGPLTLARSNLAASGNLNYGWFGGGQVPGNPLLSQVDRIDYANDLSTSIVRGPLGSGRYSFGATGNSNFGYFGLGSQQTIVERISYSNDSVIAIRRGDFITGRTYTVSCATGNSNFGYFGGGLQGGISLSLVDRVNYSNDLVTPSPRGSLSSLKNFTSGSGNSNFGYFAGGSLVSPDSNIPVRTEVDRIDYSNDTAISLIRGPLSTATRDASATSSASFGGSPVSYLGAPWVATAPYGYFGAGQDRAVDAGNTTNIYPSSIERLDYSNDTGAQIIRSSLQEGIEQPTGLSNDKFGYVCGGLLRPSTAFSPQVFKTYVQRLDYSNDTILDAGSLLHASYAHCPLGNINYGYVVGGLGPGPLAAIQKIDYSNDNATSVDTANTQITSYLASGTSNKNYGYLFGGDVGGSSTYIQRFDFSNDSNNATIRAYTDKSTASDAATGNENYGYNYDSAFGLPVSYIGRLDYSNDTQGSLQRTSLSVVRLFNRATGNSNSGYWAGGANSSAGARDIQKLDFSNDTQILSVRGYLVKERYAHSSFSPQAFGGAPNTTTDPLPTYIRANTVFDDKNTLELPFKRALGSFGYFVGGSSISTIERIDFSNDNVPSLVRGNASQTKFRVASVGNSNFGYVGPSSPSTQIDRIDYSNDTSSIVRGNSLNMTNYSSFGTKNFGYFMGRDGFSSATEYRRIDYSNDGNTALDRAFLPIGSSRGTATETKNFGYYAGGASAPGPNSAISNVQRLNFYNDTAYGLVRGNLPTTKFRASSTGNENYGYFGGGLDDTDSSGQNQVSRIERFDYSNDLANGIPRAFFDGIRSNGKAITNSSYGYFQSTNISNIERLDYSNDTLDAVRRGPLSSAKGYIGATTNARSS